MIPDNIEAYIFDLDGTLIDSNGVWKEIDRLIFEKNNVSLSDTELNAAAAMNYSDFLGFLRSYGIVYTLDELKSELDGYAVIKYSSEIKLKSGVKEYLDKLKKAGKKIFLATASPEKLYAPVLKNNGVYGYFDGFVTTEEVQEFTFEYAGEDQAEVSYDFIFENQPTTVELTKTDLTTGKELPGAHLKVTDSDGNTVDEWTSTEESHVIKELVVGKKYTMTETKPSDGYVTAESITFTVENTAEVQKHEMKDDVTKVEISKTDITGETEIPGAKLTILDKDDQVVESWTSTEETHYIEKLPIGKYTLREEQAPKGYLLTSDVTFEVTDTGEVQKVAMKDDTAKGKVILNKTDKSSGEPLKGVEFELRDSKGKVLETLKTDAAGHAESKLYEIATFKNGKYDTAIKYYLVETKTLDGYTLDQTKHEVTFSYVNDSTPVVEVTFNLTNEKPEVPETPNTPETPQSHEETKVSNAPKTGDSTNIWLPILLLVISTGGMAGIYFSRKRKSK